MDFEKIAQDVFEYQNKLRENPQIAIPSLEARLPYFKGNILKMPGTKPLQYKEGAACVQECIDFLKVQKPLPALQYEKGLELSARDHGLDLGTNGTTGHTGTDGSNTAKRISKYGLWKPGPAGQNISYGKTTEEDVLLQLIVDDGKPDRGHRHNVFDPDYKLVGVYQGEHSKFKYITVMDYCKKFTMKGEKKKKQQQQQQDLVEQVEKLDIEEQEQEDTEQNIQVKEANFQGDNWIEQEAQENIEQQQDFQQNEQQEEEQQIEEQIDEQQQQQQQQEEQQQQQQKSKVIKPAGCIKIIKKIKDIVQDGQKMKQITYIFKMKDGSEQKQVVIE